LTESGEQILEGGSSPSFLLTSERLCKKIKLGSTMEGAKERARVFGRCSEGLLKVQQRGEIHLNRFQVRYQGCFGGGKKQDSSRVSGRKGEEEEEEGEKKDVRCVGEEELRSSRELFGKNDN